jgi:hypothetical protein
MKARPRLIVALAYGIAGGAFTGVVALSSAESAVGPPMLPMLLVGVLAVATAWLAIGRA